MDNYVLVERLGQGSFAVVWKARRRSDNRLVAAKQLKQAPATWEECKALPEIRAAIATRNAPSVIGLLEAVRHGSELILVFEYADSNLHQCMVGRPRVDEQQVRWAGRQLLVGLAAIHAAGLVHCDVKPENLLIVLRDGPSRLPALKVGDLGQAALPSEVGTYVGTRWYRAPELLLEARAGPEIDVWAAGCLMVELFLLRPAFPGQSTQDMLFRMCQALGGPEAGWPLSQRLADASGLRLSMPPAGQGPLWPELHAAGVSQPATELLSQVLQYDQAKRWQASRALKASFFTGGEPELPILPPKVHRPASPATVQGRRDEAKAMERQLHQAGRQDSKEAGARQQSSTPTPLAPQPARQTSSTSTTTGAPIAGRGWSPPPGRRSPDADSWAAPRASQGLGGRLVRTPPWAQEPVVIEADSMPAFSSLHCGQQEAWRLPPARRSSADAGCRRPSDDKASDTTPKALSPSAPLAVDDSDSESDDLPVGAQGAGSCDDDDEELAAMFWNQVESDRAGLSAPPPAKPAEARQRRIATPT